jgi:hypothetical protein
MGGGPCDCGVLDYVEIRARAEVMLDRFDEHSHVNVGSAARMARDVVALLDTLAAVGEEPGLLKETEVLLAETVMRAERAEKERDEAREEIDEWVMARDVWQHRNERAEAEVVALRCLAALPPSFAVVANANHARTANTSAEMSGARPATECSDSGEANPADTAGIRARDEA